MKKKITLFISMMMALMMAFSLAACKDNTGEGGGEVLPPGGGGGVAPITSVTTVDGAYQYFENLPSGSSAAEVDNILQDAFGIDLTFPTAERIYSSDGSGSMGNQTYTYYVVTIDNTEQTGEGFYNSIKPTMVAAGYEGEDATLSFGKVIGDIVYTFEIDGRNGWIRIQINAYEYVEVWNPQVNVPENLKVVYNDDGITMVAVKIGNDYYSEYRSGGIVVMKYFSEYDEATQTWTLYDWNYGTNWGYYDYMGNNRYTTTSESIVQSIAFAFMVDYSMFSEYQADGTATVLTRTANKYIFEGESIINEYYADAQTGLILKVISGSRTSQVTEWDETVTSFDRYDLPNTQGE